MDNKLNELLERANLRSTTGRIQLLGLLFSFDTRHITAEELFTEAAEKNIILSLATVYNTLHALTAVNILKKVVVNPSRIYFDTNTKPHYHLYYEKTGNLIDIPQTGLNLSFHKEEMQFLKNVPEYQTEIILRVS